MVWRDGGWRCVREDSTPLPPVDGAGDPLSHPALADSVCGLLSGAKRRQVYVSISSSEVLLRRIQLPDAVPKAAAEVQRAAIKTVIENEDYIPVSLESAAYDFHLMAPGTLLVGWMRNGKLASVSEHLPERAYLTPQCVTLANQILSQYSRSERICGVHIDGGFCDLVVLEAGEFCFGRSFYVADTAQLVEAVRGSLGACPNPTAAALERIALSGDASGSIAGQLAAALKVEVTEAGFEWHTALMGAIRNGAGIRLNLLAPAHTERAAERRSKRTQLLKRMIPAAAILALLGANAWLHGAIESAHNRIGGLRREAARVETLASETKSLRKRYGTLEKPVAQLAWGDRRFPALADRLVHIANQRPKAVQLTEIKTVPLPRGAKAQSAFDARRVLILVGIAPAQAEIDAFRAALVVQAEFSSVRQVKTEQVTVIGERRLEFTLALESSGQWLVVSGQ